MASGPKPFDSDVAAHGGYRYTTDAQLSSRIANARISDAVLSISSVAGKRVIDIGCGDGTYTRELADRGGAAEVVGVDPAEEAIGVARRETDDERIRFARGNAYEMEYSEGTFDLAHLRGVLHHLDRPPDALREALRLASEIVVVEPNGYNPGLKLLERVSRYHREHAERSFGARRLDGWVQQAGGEVVARRWIGQVPMFCPDPVARLAKRVEPMTEALPGVRLASCAQYLFVARRRSTG